MAPKKPSKKKDVETEKAAAELIAEYLPGSDRSKVGKATLIVKELSRAGFKIVEA